MCGFMSEAYSEIKKTEENKKVGKLDVGIKQQNDNIVNQPPEAVQHLERPRGLHV